MSRRFDAKTTSALVKLVVFLAVTSVATTLLVITIGNLTFGEKRTYSAVFTDVTGVAEGDDVRIAGVRVGSVEDIQLHDRDRALVTFTVERSSTLTAASHVTVRYRNLVGQRYLAITGADSAAPALEDGARIPESRTTEALDLTVLFNGFKPLFTALSPADLNQLSYEIIQVFQGEGGTLEGLLGHTASVTQTLVARDQVIDDLLENLNQVLDHLGDRDEELSTLLVTFRDFMAGLKKDREAILGSLDQISELAVTTADLAADVREPLTADIKELRRLTANLDRNKAEIDRALQVMPIKVNKIGRTATYGSFFNFYLCHFQGNVKLPAVGHVPLDYNTGGERCDLG